MTNKVFFDDKAELVNHILSKIDINSSIRVQKVLYLLYAYYGAIYGSLEQEKSYEEFETYPKRLFNANFEAWQYGPIDSEVWSAYKKNKYEAKEYDAKTPQEKNIILFLNDLISQTNEINDFGLIDRTHQDESWIEKYDDKTKHIKMDSDAIVKEYKKRYVNGRGRLDTY